MTDRSDKERERENSAQMAAQAAASAEVVGRYGAAAKEHFVAYSGVDHEHGTTMTRGLRGISQSRVSEGYAPQNIKQQAGFAAETKYTARENARRIIDGSGERYVRTDDLGRVNDPLFDHVLLNEDGMMVLGSGEQMKFVGGSPRECLAKLASPTFRKYIEADARITVPRDFYPGILTEADERISALQRQLDRAKASGNIELANQKRAEIARYQKIKSLVKDSGITNQEAIEARVHPLVSTAKDVVRVAHRAGLEQAGTGALIGGGFSIIKNSIAVIKGEKDPKEAAKAVVLETGKGALVGYANGFAGSTLQAGLKNAPRETLRSLSKTNAASVMVTSSVELGKSVVRLVRGQISGVEFLEEVGQKGVGQLSGAMFAAVGQVAIPIPVVGAMVGSMIGYALSTAFYGEVFKALTEAKIAREERIRIEKECQEAVQYIRQCRQEMRRITSQYLIEHQRVFDSAFSQMDEALVSGDIDQFVAGANAITESLGGHVQYRTFEEFKSAINDKNSRLIL